MAALPDQHDPHEELLGPWRDRPLPELVDHIVGHYHRKLERDLRRLMDLAELCRKRQHGDPALLLQVHRTLLALTDELLEHMTKEELILFPWLLGGNPRTAGSPIAAMQQDHKRAAVLLARMSSLTNGYEPPSGSCTTWCRLVLGLRELTQDLDEHMLLEDHVLFPRALSST